MLRVYGASDDLIEIEVDNGEGYSSLDEIDCFERDVRITFTDGTVVKFHYGKGDKAIWQVVVLEEGDAEQDIEVCANEDDDIYSDILYISSEIDSYDLLDIAEPPFVDDESTGDIDDG